VAEQGKRVLVIDDANLVRLYYRKALEEAGFEVDEALNGIEALEKLTENPVDLLIIDINMPQMDGLTFLATIRRQPPPLSSIPALITSTEAREQDFASARAAGANFYLTKPVSQEVLVEFSSLLSGKSG
jgi:two-component system, chemotaxis family, chemotaxis protein CheY